MKLHLSLVLSTALLGAGVSGCSSARTFEVTVLLPDGSPAAGAELDVWQRWMDPAPYRTETPLCTDADGRARIPLVESATANWARLHGHGAGVFGFDESGLIVHARLLHSGRQYAASGRGEFTGNGGGPRPMVLRLEDQARARIRADRESTKASGLPFVAVRVLDPRGAPLGDARVTFRFLFPGGLEPDVERILVDGEAMARVPGLDQAGRAWIEVGNPADATERPLPLGHGLFGPFDIPAGGTELEVRLAPERFLDGRLVDPDGVGIPGATVHAAPTWAELEGRVSWTGALVSSAVTDARGRFRLPQLGDREYAVDVAPPGAWIPVEGIRVRPDGGPLRIELRPSTPATISVVDGAGRAVAGARVRALSPTREISGYTDAGGRVELGNLEGRLAGTLRIGPPEGRSDLGGTVVDGWFPGDLTVPLPPSPRLPRHGR